VISTKYRLPWRIGNSPTLSLCLTNGCGFDCCSSECRPRPLDALKRELGYVERWPRADSIALVGGEPSRHPDLNELVKAASAVRGKVVLCTNGYDLGPERLNELRDLGLWGVNLRINRNQARPGWRDRNEDQLEGLRNHYAEMIARVGGLSCGFEMDVPEGDFRRLADTLAWAERNVDQVQRVVLHLMDDGPQDTHGVRPGDMADNWAASGEVAAIDPAEVAGSVAWRVGRRGRDILAASPRLLRLLCEAYESRHRRHFAYLNPQSFRSQLSCWIGALSDMSLRPLAKEIIASLRHPTRAMSPRLASQFLFTLESDVQLPQAPCAGAGWDSLAMPVSAVVLSTAGAGES
jgi:hypothetical protein